MGSTMEAYNQDSERYLTIDGVAAILQHSFVWKLIGLGNLERTIIGGHALIPESNLDEYQNQQFMKFEPPEGYLNSKSASERSGYNPHHLGRLAKRKKIKTKIKNDNVYFSKRSLDIYVRKMNEPPKGFLTRQEAKSLIGISFPYLKKLANDGILDSVKLGRRLYISESDSKSYLKSWNNPEKRKQAAQGYLTFSDASKASGYGDRNLRKLADNGSIGSRTSNGQKYVSLSDIQAYQADPYYLHKRAQASEGFLILAEASSKTGYRKEHLSYQASNGKIEKRIVHDRIFLSSFSLISYWIDNTPRRKMSDENLKNIEEIVETTGIPPSLVDELEELGISVTPDNVLVH